MTIDELIETFKKYPPGMQVVVKGYEDGFNDIDTIKQVSIILNANEEWWYGAHADSKDKPGIPALLLSGENKYAKER
jgi:hypothetical protein